MKNSMPVVRSALAHRLYGIRCKYIVPYRFDYGTLRVM